MEMKEMKVKMKMKMCLVGLGKLLQFVFKVQVAGGIPFALSLDVKMQDMCSYIVALCNCGIATRTLSGNVANSTSTQLVAVELGVCVCGPRGGTDLKQHEWLHAIFDFSSLLCAYGATPTCNQQMYSLILRRAFFYSKLA